MKSASGTPLGKSIAAALLVMTGIAGCARSGEQVVPEASHAAGPHSGYWNAYLAAAAEADRIEDVVERCLAYPDLPGNAWPEGSADARCPLLGGPSPTLAEIESQLAEADGAARLDERFGAMLESHYRDPAQQGVIFRAFYAFSGDMASRNAAEAWLAGSPESAFARMALGRHLLSKAGEARGDARIDETSASRIQTTQRILPHAVETLQSALAIEPRLSPACTDLMTAARFGNDAALRESATTHCVRVDPVSWNMRFQWQMLRDPRWGGSFEALDASVEELRPLVPKNPALGGMLARGVGMRAYLAYLGGTPLRDLSDAFDEASRISPDPLFIGNAGIAAKLRGDLPQALGYLSQAIRLAPDNSRFIAERADVRSKLGDPEGAIVDARRAIAIDAGTGRTHSTLGQALAKLGRTQEAREAYRDAMQFPAQRKWAFRRWCETYILGGVQREEALACTQGLLSEYPDDVESLFMRSWVLYELGDPGADTVAERFHAAVDPKDVRQQRMKSELARIADRR